ncbi:unnamed protein product, partial [Staurois parvus]
QRARPREALVPPVPCGRIKDSCHLRSLLPPPVMEGISENRLEAADCCQGRGTNKIVGRDCTYHWGSVLLYHHRQCWQVLHRCGHFRKEKGDFFFLNNQ